MEEQQHYSRMKKNTLSSYCLKRNISYKTGLKYFKEKSLDDVSKYETDERGGSVRHYVTTTSINFEIVLELNKIMKDIESLIKTLNN